MRLVEKVESCAVVRGIDVPSPPEPWYVIMYLRASPGPNVGEDTSTDEPCELPGVPGSWFPGLHVPSSSISRTQTAFPGAVRPPPPVVVVVGATVLVVVVSVVVALVPVAVLAVVDSVVPLVIVTNPVVVVVAEAEFQRKKVIWSKKTATDPTELAPTKPVSSCKVLPHPSAYAAGTTDPSTVLITPSNET
jgi:hypothetical protein